MIQIIDRAIRSLIAQPLVDALQLDVVRWPVSISRSATIAFSLSTFAVAYLFLAAMMPCEAAVSLGVGASHVLSVRIDVRMGAIRRHDALASFGRIVQIFETVGCLVFLGYVSSSGSFLWTGLTMIFMVGLLMSSAIAYVSICDRPPPPRRQGRLALSRT